MLDYPSKLKLHIAKSLERSNRRTSFVEKPGGEKASAATSSVLFLLGNYSMNGHGPEPSILLNKRSCSVAQPGDLCFPGGGVAPKIDPYLSKIMPFPGMPLARWHYWRRWRTERPVEARWISLMMATCLRESFEEMRLNPLGVKFLGPLPSQRLRMFRKEIYPMVAWGDRQRKFYPNWEVDKVVTIPFRSLLNPNHYARFRLSFPPGVGGGIEGSVEEFPCFILDNGYEKETLWGVTFRIVADFLELVFGFAPPPAETLPVVPGILKDGYMGSGRGAHCR